MKASGAPKLIYHLDDTITACKVAARTIREKFQDAELKQFQTPKLFFEAIESSTAVPWLILCDINMPRISGFDVLSILKRHSRLHFAPVVMLTAEQNPEDRQFAMKCGAFDYVLKPLTNESLDNLSERRRRLGEDYDSLIELDRNFSDEMSDLLSNCRNILNVASNELNEEKLNEIYRMFHTVKGGANSLSFPLLGSFVHEAEAFLSAIKAARLYKHSKSFELLSDALRYLEEQSTLIRERKLLALSPHALVEEMRLMKIAIADGRAVSEERASSASVSPEAAEPTSATSTSNGIVGRTASNVRVSHEKLNELQTRFKRILTTKLKINSFAQQLKSEFFDEKFPDELVKMAEELNSASLDIMEFFIQIRVVPASRLKVFGDRVLSQASATLSKPAVLAFECAPGLEIDLPVIECLENALTHLIRNALDHGIEGQLDRQKANKALEGKLILKVEQESETKIRVTLSDDGQGINAEKLRQIVSKKSLVASDILKNMSDEEAFYLIFLDELSTKEEVSEISGRGVGLSAVKKQIEDMGGRILISSKAGQGSEFLIQLPRIFEL